MVFFRRISWTQPLGVALTLTLCATWGCGKEKPPAPEVSKSTPEGPKASPQHFLPDKDAVILTFAGERGVFQDTSKPEDVPKDAKGLVRVRFLEGGQQPGAGKIWVTNLESKTPDGYLLQPLARQDFELAALGRGRRSKIELPEGLELPKVVQTDGVIIYKTAWCGVCTKVQQYLKQKGVAFVAKDIEKDPKAAAELQAKAKKAGVSTGSVPVIDVHGKLMVGFDKGRLDQMLKGA